MGQLTRDAETRILRWLLISPTDTTIMPTHPIRVKLMSVTGDSETAGVEVVGDLYSPVNSDWGITTLSPGGTAINLSDIVFSGISSASSVTVAGVELWDSGTIPLRLAWADLSSAAVVSESAPLVIGRGQVKVSIL